MTSLGNSLVMAAIQATIVALLAVGVVVWFGRRSPRTGAFLAVTALSACALLSLTSLLPAQHWWTWESPTAMVADVPSVETQQVELDPDATAHEWRISLGKLTSLLAPVDRQPAKPEPRWNAWNVIAIVFLVGLAVEAMRLMVGLWTVSTIRRRSSPVTDPALLNEVNSLRRELGVAQTVAIHQSSAIGTAATVGWYRPLILLAADWPTWTPEERQAVLAHELAHVQRRDYLTVVLASVCRTVHFYHPLIRWLTARLRLHQELAADSLAASATGGRPSYLRSLARLALRHDAVVAAGMARPFLSDRTSLLRRIGMLRVMEDRRPLGRAAGWSLAAALGIAALAVSALRGPAQSPTAGNESTPPADLPAWELSHVPATANCLVAIRPAAIMSRPGMKAVADRFNSSLAKAIQDAGFPADMKVQIQDIEQIVIASEGKRVPPPPGVVWTPNESQNALLMNTVLVRMTNDFDWPGMIRKGAAAFKAEVREELPGLFLVTGSDAALYFKIVDKRTIYMLEGASESADTNRDALLTRLKPAADPTSAWGPSWSNMKGAGAIVAFDNRSGFWTTSLKGKEEVAAFLTPLGRPTHVVAGLDLADTISFRIHATSADERIAELSRVQIEGVVAMMSSGIKETPVTTDAEKTAFRVAGEFLENRSIRRNGTTVSAEFRSQTQLAEILKVIELPATVKE